MYRLHCGVSRRRLIAVQGDCVFLTNILYPMEPSPVLSVTHDAIVTIRSSVSEAQVCEHA